ncbi:MAG TPA: SH3 domain-containing protein [Candidatus Babeliales bacterium]|nr:SH3 domain-containing protein [Candidatus Babeliales bacterium]
MKKNILSIILFFFTHVSFSHQYDIAADLYAQKKFQEAFDTYDSIQNKLPEVWFNMGICAYNLEKYPLAQICFGRAQKNSSYQLWDLSQKWNNKIKAKYGALTPTLTQQLRSALYHFYILISRYLGILIIQLIFLILLILLQFILLFKNHYPFLTKHKKLVSTTLAICIFTFGIILLCSWQEQKTIRAIINQKNVYLHTGPESTYHIIGEIEYGDEIFIDQECKAWYKIQCPPSSSNSHGWIKKETCEII